MGIAEDPDWLMSKSMSKYHSLEPHEHDYDFGCKANNCDVFSAGGILKEAISCLEKRGEKYNKDNNKVGRERHMQDIVDVFELVTKKHLTPQEGWTFMICLKLVRSAANGGHDCFVDGAAYFALAGELEK